MGKYINEKENKNKKYFVFNLVYYYSFICCWICRGTRNKRLGFRVVTQVERIPKEILEGFQGCSSTAIADVVGKMFTMSRGIKPLYAPIQPLDRAYRDMEELNGIDFPVYARGLQAKPPRKVGLGEINTVIDCGGVPIHPGDVIVADEEGIVVIPLKYAEAVLEKVKQMISKDVDRWNDLDKFESDQKKSFDKILVYSGCEVE